MNVRTLPLAFAVLGLLAAPGPLPAQQTPAPPQLSGIYPHLAVYNDEGECGIGGVVPWAGSLWLVTYAPHRPNGSTDKLYRVAPDLKLQVHPASIGGTPANRMIHAESQQLFLGPYAIGADGTVRAIPYTEMPGRPTGTARHLTRPNERVVHATMEEGVYEVDVRTLEVVERFADAQPGRQPSQQQGQQQGQQQDRFAALPGYHGKGFYSGQGVYVYANNGEYGREAQRRPDVASGVLAEWDGVSDTWTVVRRNQFTEVTGPGGLRGNADPATDPIWTVGWDHRSLLLGVRRAKAAGDDGGPWRFFRLPKASHAYDGAHGWNTEWPRIRDIGERDLLMTMHGTFWRFPRDFGATRFAGVAPRSNYLKVVGDFCRWGDRVVLGCDDTAKNEFLNQRRAKGRIAAAQSHSNLWFVEPAQLDRLGPAIGRGAVWIDEDVVAGQASDPFLFDGYDLRGVHLSHRGGEAVSVRLQIGTGAADGWQPLEVVQLLPGGHRFVPLRATVPQPWIRVVAEHDTKGLTAAFGYRQLDLRSERPAARFAGLALPGRPCTGGLLRARGGNLRTLSLLASTPDGDELGYYELDQDLQLRRVEAPDVATYTREHAAIPTGVLEQDAASVRFVDDQGRAWRLPFGDEAFDRPTFGSCRVDREVVTERDLFHAHGTFYELPAPNAGGFARLRPIATHRFQVHDFCGYRGLLVVSGVASDAPASNPHVLRSDDGRCALWAGAIDDLWQLGKPRGRGGPWRDHEVAADVPSEPFLMSGFDHKELTVSADRAVTMVAELDVTGDGRWVRFRRYRLQPDQPITDVLPRELTAYWIRFRVDRSCTATAQLRYR
ncbi:MAG: hypothetical protein ACE37K_08735 [Planctomycetota bacterium]